MVNFKWTYADESIDSCRKIRKAVFNGEQKIKVNYEFDEKDSVSFHVLMSGETGDIGTGRLTQTDEKTVHFSRIAISESFRKGGYGKKLLDEMIKKAKSLGAEQITVNAQTHAIKFYEKSGFATNSIERENEGVKSVLMVRDLIFDDAEFFGFPEDVEAAIVRKAFVFENIKKAKVQIVSLGFCEPYFNGKKLTEDKLIPAWTNYESRDHSNAIYPIFDTLTHRCYFLEYDLTELFQNGKNAFSLHIGNGWYNQHEQSIEGMLPYGEIKYAFKITLEDENGNISFINSDGSESYIDSFVVRTNIYLNETIDARKFDESIFEIEYDETKLKKPIKKERPTTVFVKQNFPGDKIKYSITPTLLREKDGKKLYDLKKNVSGFSVLKFSDSADIGDEASVSYSEILNEDLTQNLRTTGGECRHQKDLFINGKNRCPLTNVFAWRAGRFIEVEGNAELVSFNVVNSDVPLTAEFTSNNETLNWLFDAYVNTQSNNIHSFVPSDCPHRERLGYTGDGQLCSAAVMTMFDAEKLYTKWMQDIADAQDIFNGHVEHTAPFYGGGGGPGGWGGAIAIVPYNMYKFYGDENALRKYYPQILSYIEYMLEHSENGVVVREEDKGWCLGDWCTLNRDIKIPNELVNTYFLIKALSIAVEAAELFGKTEDLPYLQEKLIETENAFVNSFFDEETGSFAGGIQGSDAFAVDLNLGDERTLENIVKKYSEIKTYDTGIFGTDILTRVLFENGYGELAFTLLTNEKIESFYNMKKNGATTLWEHWNGVQSHSHPMFGAVCEYLFKYILGIKQTATSHGYEEVEISPAKIPGLNVSGSITTKRGKISVSVKYTDDVRSVKFTLPETVKISEEKQ